MYRDGRIYQRGGIWWIAYYHRDREIRESAHTTSETTARRHLRKRLKTAGTSDLIGPEEEKLTFDDLGELLLTDYRINRKRTLRAVTRRVNQLRTFFSDDRALDMTPDKIAAYVETRQQEGREPATINRELAALRRMFSLAVKQAKLRHRPHVALLAEDNVREGFL